MPEKKAQLTRGSSQTPKAFGAGYIIRYKVFKH